MHSLYLNVRVNWVTCPGVWLCQKGHVVLRITAFGTTSYSERLYPKFPLPVDHTFTFQRVTIGIFALAAFMDDEEICFELIQWMSLHSKLGVVLARFTRRLTHCFESILIEENVSISSRLDLLMEKTEYFPGIISPKLTATFHLQIAPLERNAAKNNAVYETRFPFTYPLRQRTVCHARSLYPQFVFLNGTRFPCGRTINEKSDGWQMGRSIVDMKNKPISPFCWWCADPNTSCACSSCLQYHLTFH